MVLSHQLLSYSFVSLLCNHQLIKQLSWPLWTKTYRGCISLLFAIILSNPRGVNWTGLDWNRQRAPGSLVTDKYRNLIGNRWRNLLYSGGRSQLYCQSKAYSQRTPIEMELNSMVLQDTAHFKGILVRYGNNSHYDQLSNSSNFQGGWRQLCFL